MGFIQRVLPAPELSATMTGSWVSIGQLIGAPTRIVFDNQSTVTVALSFDGGTTTWHTFPAGEAIIMDLSDESPTLKEGTTIHGNGASGTFSVSYFYKDYP